MLIQFSRSWTGFAQFLFSIFCYEYLSQSLARGRSGTVHAGLTYKSFGQIRQLHPCVYLANDALGRIVDWRTEEWTRLN
jgi:hypothetical protein